MVPGLGRTQGVVHSGYARLVWRRPGSRGIRAGQHGSASTERRHFPGSEHGRRRSPRDGRGQARRCVERGDERGLDRVRRARAALRCRTPPAPPGEPPRDGLDDAVRDRLHRLQPGRHSARTPGSLPGTGSAARAPERTRPAGRPRPTSYSGARPAADGLRPTASGLFADAIRASLGPPGGLTRPRATSVRAGGVSSPVKRHHGERSEKPGPGRACVEEETRA